MMDSQRFPIGRSTPAILPACLVFLAVATSAATTLVVYPLDPDHESDGRVSGSLNGQAVTFSYQYTRHPSSQGQKDFKANYVRFAADGPVNVSLTVHATINSAALRTVGKDLTFTRTGSSLQFVLPGPGTYYLQLPDLNTPGKITYTVFFFFDDLAVYTSYQQLFASARNVLNHGVVSHYTMDQTSAVQNVLNGRGAIYFPAGMYRTRPLSIGSNTTIYLAPGAVLKGTDDYNAIQYIYINGTSNVQIAGLGAIDVNGFTSANDNTKGHGIDMESSTDLTLKDVCIRDSNSWLLHIRRCDRVYFGNLKLFSGKDGIDPDGSRDVMIEKTCIQSIDDAFAVKSKFSGRSCERVTMRDCIVFSCASSLKIGTENYYGVVRDIVWDHCDAVDADRGCILYTNAEDGSAPVSNITWRNIRIFNFAWTAEDGGSPFQFRNLSGSPVSNLLVENVVAYPKTGCSTSGSFSARFRNVIVSDPAPISGGGIAFEGVIWPSVVSQQRPVVFIDPSPRNQSDYYNGDTVSVSVRHPFGTGITRVELLVDGVSAGVRTTLPYHFVLSGLSVGEHVLRAVATDAAGATNTTAPKRIQVRANTVPTIIDYSLSATTLMADQTTAYSVSLTVEDRDSVNDIRGMRVMFHNGGEFNSANGRGYLAWGQTDADITLWNPTWTVFAAAGGGRWGWDNTTYGADTYIVPAWASTSTSGNRRTVTWTFQVKPAWAVATGQRLRVFAHDMVVAGTGWVETPLTYDVLSVGPLPTPTVSLTPTHTHTPSATPLADTDQDSVPDILEGWPPLPGHTHSLLPDSDGDGLGDGDEDANRNGQREIWETDACNRDTDGDGLLDGIEVRVLGTDPLFATQPGAYTDTDRDGLPASHDLFDMVPDADGDRFSDGYEAAVLHLNAAYNVLLVPPLGDLNLDGSVTNIDGLIVQALFLSLAGPSDPVFQGAGFRNADLNRDGFITNIDGLVAQAYFLSLAAILPP